jgi:son of sevenless-like protein
MVGAGLRIDTSVVAQTLLGSSERSAIRERSLTPGSAYLKQAHSPREWRSRRASTASTSSSLSIISPDSSSTNASPTSPHFHNDQTSSISSFHPSAYSPESPTSPLLDETLRLTSEYVLAMHDYSPQQQNATCLSFLAGQVIHVLNRDVSGWWDGELEGRRGWFPSNYVNAEVDCTSLIEEELPRKPVSRVTAQ